MILNIHRKDLRTSDLPVFEAIRSSGSRSLHLLILEPFLLRKQRYLEHSGVNFLTQVSRLQQEYATEGKQLHILYGEPDIIVKRLSETYPIQELMVHADYTLMH